MKMQTSTILQAPMNECYERFPKYIEQINRALTSHLDNIETPATQLVEAMRYSVLSGGKRIRPLLVLLTGEMLGVESSTLLRSACAIEFIHCYSLIHDDLPAMDDDDLRRGLPTCHIKFDEATAILAGDALQTEAFEMLAQETHINGEQRLKMISSLTRAIGCSGMAGGQMLDLIAAGKQLSQSDLEQIHKLKTSHLLGVSIEFASIAANCENKEKIALMNFAQCIGLGFQIKDDLLDVESTSEQLGKPQGSDAALAKPTFATIMSVADAKKCLDQIHQQAISHIKNFSNNERLLQLTQYLLTRNF